MCSVAWTWLLCMNVDYCSTEVLQALAIVGGGNFKSLISIELRVDDDPDDTQTQALDTHWLLNNMNALHLCTKSLWPCQRTWIFKTACRVTPRPSTYICGIILHNFGNMTFEIASLIFHSLTFITLKVINVFSHDRLHDVCFYFAVLYIHFALCFCCFWANLNRI